MTQARLAQSANGNISLWTEPTHPNFPPMALPASEFPTPASAATYADALLQACRLLPANTPAVWIPCGYTDHPRQGRVAALGAPLPEPSPAPKGV